MNDTCPSWSHTFDVVGPTPSQTFYIGVQCRNMPTDGQVGFTIDQPAPMPPIVEAMAPILNPNMLKIVQVEPWPAGAQGSLTIDYQQGATPPPAGASISPVVMVPAQQAALEPMSF